MRKIDLYQAEPEAILGDDKNMHALKEKLLIDNLLLTDIEADYQRDKEGYREEYFQAKINYLTNKYMYFWYYIKYYFDFGIYSLLNSRPNDYHQEMREKGWMMPAESSRYHIRASGDVSLEETYIKYFNKYFNVLFSFPVGDFGSRIDRCYQQAISCYKSGYYYSCALSLFPIIESYHQEMAGFEENEYYKIKNHLDCIVDKISQVKQTYATQINYYIDLVKQFNDLVKNHYFNTSVDRDVEPEIINRHRIMHGIFTRDISQKDCLQLFCVISNMRLIHSLIDANAIMEKTALQIEKLKRGEE